MQYGLSDIESDPVSGWAAWLWSLPHEVAEVNIRDGTT